MDDRKLMEYFQFDMQDLYANQNGRFTEGQKVRLAELAKSRRRTGLGIGIALAVIGLIGPVVAVLVILSNNEPGFIIGFGLGFGVVWPLIWGGIGYLMIKGALEKHEPKLTSVQGRANIVARESRTEDSDGHTSTRIYHELHVGGQTFSVNRDIADVIFQGDEYIIYYADPARDITSVEAVSKK
jgi:hypothetical protein